MDDANSLAGQVLLAMPGIGDPRFDRSVIAICAHGPEGAMGVGIGAVIEGLDARRLLRRLSIEGDAGVDIPVHVGGPVSPERGFVFHSNDWRGKDGIDVAGRWALTTTTDALSAIGAGAGPSRWLIALGYAGWGPGQLDGELTRHGWFHVPGNDALLFDTAPDQRWLAGFASAGIDPSLLSSTSGSA